MRERERARARARAGAPVTDPEVAKYEEEIAAFLGNKAETSLSGDKEEVDNIFAELKESVVEKFVDESAENEKKVKTAFDAVKKEQIRQAPIAYFCFT